MFVYVKQVLIQMPVEIKLKKNNSVGSILKYVRFCDQRLHLFCMLKILNLYYKS